MHLYWPIANQLEQNEMKRPDRLIKNNKRSAMWESRIPSTIVQTVLIQFYSTLSSTVCEYGINL